MSVLTYDPDMPEWRYVSGIELIRAIATMGPTSTSRAGGSHTGRCSDLTGIASRADRRRHHPAKRRARLRSGPKTSSTWPNCCAGQRLIDDAEGYVPVAADRRGTHLVDLRASRRSAAGVPARRCPFGTHNDLRSANTALSGCDHPLESLVPHCRPSQQELGPAFIGWSRDTPDSRRGACAVDKKDTPETAIWATPARACGTRMLRKRTPPLFCQRAMHGRPFFGPNRNKPLNEP